MKKTVIIGGGLSGLVNAIQLSKAGVEVHLVEKKTYPFHRVCGEYVSNETLPFLNSLGFDPISLGAISIDNFLVSSPSGRTLSLPLDLGGFGISRYTMDEALYQIAQKSGVQFYLGHKVMKIQRQENLWTVHTNQGLVLSTELLISTHGKRANLDQQLSRGFMQARSPYLGVKYHIRTKVHPETQIALHNFKNGYCGISQIEDEKHCLCYLSHRDNLREYSNVPSMEKAILYKNPFLKKIFEESEFLYEKPEVINEVSFAPKSLLEDGIFMCGDSAGMIAPLCGNGMAMAIHGAKILSELIILHHQGQIQREELEKMYPQKWKALFARRLRIGRKIQAYFGGPRLSELLIWSGQLIPTIPRFLMAKSHGKVF